MPLAMADEIAVAELAGKVGQEIGLSGWLAVDQARIDAFAEVTGDHQFIHVDPVRAAATPFGGTVAHGFLTLSLLSALFEHSTVPRPAGLRMGINYGLDRTRFLGPVPSGSRIRARFTLQSLAEKAPGEWQQTLGVTVEVEGRDKPALAAEWLSRFYV